MFYKICEEAEFGRSLFERLVSLGHKKQLLNVQYRMHPSISLFPNRDFYDKQILDGPNESSTYGKRFLQGNMYGSYSFLNVTSAKEELDRSHSTKNTMEVALAAEIIASLFKGTSCTPFLFFSRFGILVWLLSSQKLLQENEG